jgi:hypothetical protein
VIDRNYNVNYAFTANIHVVIPVIDRNYDINDVMTANLAKWQNLFGNPCHSPGLRNKWYQDKKSSKTPENYVVTPVIHRNYDEWSQYNERYTLI